MAITIGIPFYNAEKYLLDAIRSIFAQSYQDWELILIDDGSTDRSLEIARAVKDPRVRIISDGQNKRLPFRLNQIALEAKYNLVARMDADDLTSPTRLMKQLEIFNNNPEIDFISTGVCSITNDKHPAGIRLSDNVVSGRGFLLGHNPIMHGSILARKAWFLRNPYDVLQFSGDLELWTRALSKNDFHFHIINEPLYYYREEDNVVPHKLLAEYVNLRQSCRKYGVLWFKWWEIPFLPLRSYTKGIIVRFLSLCGKLDILLKIRSQEITDKNLLDQFNSEIQYIAQTKIPGVDG